MAPGSESDTQESVLSDSWTNLSDADYSIDDDLRSETTDAASVTDQAGLERVSSLDTNDVLSQSSHDEPQLSSSISLSKASTARKHGLDAGSVDTLHASHMERSIILEDPRVMSRGDQGQMSQVINPSNEKEAYSIMSHPAITEEGRQLAMTLGMQTSDKPFSFHEPFRLLYVGETKARRQILTKLGDVLMCDAHRLYHDPSVNSDSYLIRPSDLLPCDHHRLVPIETQIIVDDCATTASISEDGVHNRIFLTLKNGALYSSVWNDSSFEISSQSRWSQPDLAIFVVGPDDHPIVKQRHQLAHEFVSRHKIPILVISETVDWNYDSDDLPIDKQSPHLQVEARKNGGSPVDFQVVKLLPLDLNTFIGLVPDDLNKGLAHLSNHVAGGAPASAATFFQKRVMEPLDRAITQFRTYIEPANVSCCITPRGTDILPYCASLALLALAVIVTTVLCTAVNKTMLSMFAYMFAPTIMDLSSASVSTSTATPSYGGSQPTPVSNVPIGTPQVSSAMIPVKNKPAEEISKDIMSVSASSDLAQVVKDKSTGASNQLEKFEVHTVGDSDILIKLPNKLRPKGSKVPFKVTVSRKGKVIDSSLSKLFEGVYAARIETSEAFGLINVTIEKGKSSKPEEHVVDFGLKLFNLGRLRDIGQAASKGVQSSFGSALGIASANYDWLATEIFPRAQEASKTAAQRAQEASFSIREMLQDTGRVFENVPQTIRDAAKARQPLNYTAFRGTVDGQLQTLIQGGRSAHQAGQVALKTAQVALNRAVKTFREASLPTNPFPTRDSLRDQIKSKKLARAQDRLQQLLDQLSKGVKKQKSREKKKIACTRGRKFRGGKFRGGKFWGR